MSSNQPLEYPPDPASEILPEIEVGQDLPSITPVFSDTVAEETAQRLPESYDEKTGIATLKVESQETPDPIGRTWMFDFDKGQFFMAGATALGSGDRTEREILTQWIRRCLHTERYEYPIYPDWFGVEMKAVYSGELTGGAAIHQVTETVHDALIQHSRITDVIEIQVIEAEGMLFVDCTVLVDDDETTIRVTEILPGTLI